MIHKVQLVLSFDNLKEELEIEIKGKRQSFVIQGVENNCFKIQNKSCSARKNSCSKKKDSGCAESLIIDAKTFFETLKDCCEDKKTGLYNRCENYKRVLDDKVKIDSTSDDNFMDSIYGFDWNNFDKQHKD